MKTYTGSCHCGRVAFQAALDLSAGTMRCNCSYCRKMRVWIVRAPLSEFRYLKGGEDVTSYRTRADGEGEFQFCPTCGVRIGTRFDRPNGRRTFNIEVGVLDATVEELLAAPVIWCDGLNDAWASQPAEVRHL